MSNLSREDLWTLEEYATRRPEFRKQVMEHKKSRQLQLGDNAKLYFEDRLTIKYQIQEMLRIERIFEPGGIQDELDTYNPLIPEGSNLKATFMLEYVDPAKRDGSAGDGAGPRQGRGRTAGAPFRAGVQGLSWRPHLPRLCRYALQHRLRADAGARVGRGSRPGTCGNHRRLVPQRLPAA